MSRGPLSIRRPDLWDAARTAALPVTVAFAAGLVLRPATVTPFVWNVVIPLVPVALFLNPLIWRNICPLATANTLVSDHRATTRPPDRTARTMGVLGIALLFGLIPLRTVLFNSSGIATAVLVGSAVLAAVAAGYCFDARSGFCNTFCPVLPVERLYGSHPLISLKTHRCPTCSGCVLGCIDLSPTKAPAVALGRKRYGRSWPTTAFGAFSCAFPGIVLGYYTGPETGAAAVYVWVLGLATGSYLVFAGAAALLCLAPSLMLPVLAALAGGTYFWFAAANFASTLGLGPATTVTLRVILMGMVAGWLARALLRDRNRSRARRTA